MDSFQRKPRCNVTTNFPLSTITISSPNDHIRARLLVRNMKQKHGDYARPKLSLHEKEHVLVSLVTFLDPSHRYGEDQNLPRPIASDSKRWDTHSYVVGLGLVAGHRTASIKNADKAVGISSQR